MNLTIANGVDLRIGSGLYRLRFAFHGPRDFLIRVPFIGKAWSYGPGSSGCIGWAEAKQEAASGWDD